MSNRRITRRTDVLKKRENCFNLKQNVNESLIPQYNALHDPFLNGFFDHPAYKRHLKATGAIQRNKRLSVRHFEERLSKEGRVSRSEPKGKAKSEHNESNLQKGKDLKLPLLQEVVTEERQGVRTSETTRHKKFYKSQQM